MIKSNNTLTWRVGQLEKQVGDLDVKVEKILTNELPHLKTDIVEIKGKLETMNTRIKYGLIANSIQIAALILGIVLLLNRV
jgi:hypothetical protein